MKFGAFVRDRQRAFDARRFRFEPFSNIEETVDLSAPPEELFAEEHIAPGLFELRESTRPTDNYEAAQRAVAGYAQIELTTGGGLQSLIGARLESSDQAVTTFDPFSTEAVPIAAGAEGGRPAAEFESALQLYGAVQDAGGGVAHLDAP